MYRTGYFPGLGWMIRREKWEHDLRQSWPRKPSTGFDHWLRVHTETSGENECIYPAVPRTRHTSSRGTNVNSAESVAKFKRYVHASDRTDFTVQDLSRLLHSEYSKELKNIVTGARVYDSLQALMSSGETTKTSVVYFLEENFASIARSLNLPFSAPRCTHHGVVQTRFRGADLFLIDRRRKASSKLMHL